MATTYFDIDTGGLGDYSSLNAFQSGEATDITGIGPYVAECRASGGAADTAQVTLSGWTTDVDNDLTIRQADSDRHNGTYQDTKYRLERTSDTININNAGLYLTIDGLQAFITVGYSYVQFISGGSSWTGSTVHLRNLVVEADMTGGTYTQCQGLDMPWNSTPRGNTVYIDNCYIRGFMDTGASYSAGIYINSSFGTVYVRHCTVADCDRNFVGNASNSTSYAFNCVSRGATDDGFAGTWHSSSDYNSSDISGDAPVVSPRDNTQSPWYSGATGDSSIFLDAANGDYRLTSGAIFIDVGADLSGIVDTDVVGTSRPQGSGYDLGFFEYVSSGSTYNESLTLAANASCSGAASLMIEASLTLSTAAGISEGSQADLVGSVDLSVSAVMSQVATLIMEAAATLAAELAMLQEGSFPGNTYEESLTLAAAAGMARDLALIIEENVTLATILDQAQSATWEGDVSLVLAATAAMIQAGNIEGAEILANQFVLYLSRKAHDIEASQKTHTVKLPKKDHELLN